MNFYKVVLKNIGSIFLKYFIKNPFLFAKLAKLGINLKDSIDKLSAKDLDIKAESSIDIIDNILKFRAENPKDFDTILEVLEEMIKDYKTNPKTKEAIMSILREKQAKDNN